MFKPIQNYFKQRVLAGLWAAAAAILAHDQPLVVAVTGAVGKTTTKDAIYHVLSGTSRQPVRRAEGNLNTEFGVPLAIAGLTRVPRNSWQWLVAYSQIKLRRSSGTVGGILVLEFSSDKPGDIAWLAARVPVNVAVFTRFTLAHSGRTVAAVTKEKLSLLAGLTAKGVIVANADDPEQQSLLTDRRTISYGERAGQVRLHQVALSLTGATGIISYADHRAPLLTKLVAKHQLLSLLAAAAVGISQKISLVKLVETVATFTAPPGRMRLIKGRKGITIIDDTYNSSPAAATEALLTLQQLAALPAKEKRRAVAILGNMNELGDNTVAAHIELGRQAALARVDYLVAVGPNAKRIVRGARENGLPDAHVIDFLKPEKLLAHLDALIQSNDLILVKASQNGMRLERVVKKLMANPKEASRHLVRQD